MNYEFSAVGGDRTNEGSDCIRVVSAASTSYKFPHMMQSMISGFYSPSPTTPSSPSHIYPCTHPHPYSLAFLCYFPAPAALVPWVVGNVVLDVV